MDARFFPHTFGKWAITGRAMVWTGVLALLALLGVVLGMQIFREYDRSIASTEDRLLAEARVVNENLGAKLAFIDIIMKDVSKIMKMAHRPDEEGLNQYLYHQVQLARGIRTLLVADASGRIILSSREEIIGFESAKRDYYRAAQEAVHREQLIISPPFRSALGTTVVNVSRAFTDWQGKFGGVIAATLDQEYFATLLTSVLYAPDNSIRMVHDNGELFLSLPNRQGENGNVSLARPGTFFQLHRESGRDVSLFRGKSGFAGEERIAAVITCRPPEVNVGHPFVLVVDRQTAAVLSPWRRDALMLASLYVLFAAASVIMVIVVLKWNTERRKAEAEHARLRTLESSGILAEGIAHDFNNLLAVISAHIQMAKEAGKQESERSEILAAAMNACLRAKELSRQLLTFATGGEPVRSPMPIQGIIAGSVKEAVATSAVSAQLDLPQDLHPVPVDENQIRQVFTSLVNNAIEAMRQGGSLAVRGENISVPPRSGLELPEGAYVRVTIRDTGIGIAAENLPKIFDPYYSTKDTFSKKGLGLSLAVCHSIIRRHGGLITISSEVGTGTTVTVLLPAADHDAAASPV